MIGRKDAVVKLAEGALPQLREHRGPVALAACVCRFRDTGGEKGRFDTEHGPSVGDERPPPRKGARQPPREVCDEASFTTSTGE
jgi:hypothetical protein